jgi:hypothetical protein
LSIAEHIDNATPEAVPLAAPRLGHTGAGMDLPARFRFACLGGSFEGVVQEQDDGAVLSLRGTIRHLPYSAENPAARQRLHALLRAAPKSLPDRVILTSRQQIEFRDEVALEAPALPADVLRQTTIILLRWRPLFDLIRGRAA